ncbi:MAG: sulfatase/phosphatase domain-containing protein, partial [Myxococcota bacterium]
ALEGWDVDYDNLGQPGSIAAIGKEWASVSAAPFHLFKFNATEGGLRVPMVVSGPGVKDRGFIDSRSQVSDIAPTLLDMAGVAYSPDEFYGRSLKPMLSGEADEVYGDTDAFAFETSGTAALYRGPWKITKTPVPFGDGEWHLYDISADPGETTDVAAQHASLFEDMKSEFQSYADEVGVLEQPPGASARKQLQAHMLQMSAVNYWYVPAAMIIGLAAVLLGLLRVASMVFRRRAA